MADTTQSDGLTSTQIAGGQTKRKRVSIYNARMALQIPLKNDDAQACINIRKDIETYAISKGAIVVSASGDFGSTMIDVPK